MDAPREADPTHDSREFIHELVGVRGLALTLVVLFHLFGAGRVSGGVDVFLFISAFLLTASVTRRASAGRLSLVVQYGRTAMRLIPAALVVLGAVLLATILFAPVATWGQTGRELLASALYYENWELIASQLEYGAAGPATSPLQHFWSMSVQGQFFLVWPAVILVVAVLARRRGGLRAALIAVTGTLTVASFVYAMWLHGQAQEAAYFDSFARFWELGAGALLALTAHHLRLGRAVSIGAVWLGLAMIVSCGFFIDGASAFPGPLTLWPLAGTALVILGAGVRTRRFGPDRLLDAPPLRFLARISYPLYLWHWPILIFWIMAVDSDGIGWLSASVILTMSIVAAWLTQRFVAEPALAYRDRATTRGLVAMPVVATLVFSLVVAAGVVRIDRIELQAQQAAAAAVADDEQYPGARALAPGGTGSVNGTFFIPGAETASKDYPAPLLAGCVQGTGDLPGREAVTICEPDVVEPTRAIVLSGGSHTLHWYEALKTVAARSGWAIVVVDKDGCRLTGPDAAAEFSPYASCVEWNRRVVPVIIDLQPDALFTVGSHTPSAPHFTDETMIAGQVEVWRELDRAGIPTLAIRDTPRFESKVPECVSEHIDDLAACGVARDEIFAATDPLLEADGVPDSTVALDLTDSFCTDRCEPVVGGVLVYRDRDHITATYSLTLADALEAELRAKADWLFDAS